MAASSSGGIAARPLTALLVPADVALFLGDVQQAWFAHLPNMNRRAQQHIASFLCVRHRLGCQFGELSGHIKQLFLLDDATIKERIRHSVEAGLITAEPSTLSSRSIIMATQDLLTRYDRFLGATSSALARLQRSAGQSLTIAPEALDREARDLLAVAAHCHIGHFQAAVAGICEAGGLSRARALEARRNVLSLSHWTVLRLLLENALQHPGHSAGVLADDLAAALLKLSRQNFQTTRDHINYLISTGMLERHPGKTLHVGLSSNAAAFFLKALDATAADLGRIMAQLGEVACAPATKDQTIRLPTAGQEPDHQALRHELLVMRGSDFVETFILPSGETIVGRGAPSAIRLESHTISRTHFCIDIGSDRTAITDMQSTNGTFVDNIRLQKRETLKPGALIGAGVYRIIYQAVDTAAAASPTRPRKAVRPSRSNPEV